MKRREWNWWGHGVGVGSTELDGRKKEEEDRKRRRRDMVAAMGWLVSTLLC